MVIFKQKGKFEYQIQCFTKKPLYISLLPNNTISKKFDSVISSIQAMSEIMGKVFDEYVFDRRNDLPSWKDDVKDLMAGTPNPNLEFYLPMIYSQPGSIIDYLSESAGIVIDDFLELETVAHELQKHAQQLADEQPAEERTFAQVKRAPGCADKASYRSGNELQEQQHCDGGWAKSEQAV